MTAPIVRPVCWADAPIITNFEAVTLPLLYAPEEDCKHYFQAMKRKHPRKGLALEAVFSLCLEARAAKGAGNYMEALEKLHQSAQRRLHIFQATDYQVAAAFEHCIWAALHFGVMELSSTKGSAVSTASALFSFALDVIRECRTAVPPTSGTDGGSAGRPSRLSPFVLTLLEFVLHYNWTSYFVHRSKWHAAVQHAIHAEQRWQRLAQPDGEGVSDMQSFLTVRRLVVEDRLGTDLQRVRRELLAVATKAVPHQPEEVDTTAASLADAAPSEHEEAAAHSAEGPVPQVNSLLTMNVASAEDQRELTVCLSAARPANAWHGSLSNATAFMKTFGSASVECSLREFDNAQHLLLECAAKLQQAGAASNSLWRDHVAAQLQWCVTRAQELAATGAHPMPKEMTRADGLQIQRLLKKFLLSERARKQRIAQEQVRKRQVLDDGVDEDADPEEVEAKWRIAPSKEEREGLLLDESKFSPIVAGFSAMFPLIQKKIRPDVALKHLQSASLPIVSPSEVTRNTLASRQAVRAAGPDESTASADATRALLLEHAVQCAMNQTMPSMPVEKVAVAPRALTPKPKVSRLMEAYGVTADAPKASHHEPRTTTAMLASPTRNLPSSPTSASPVDTRRHTLAEVAYDFQLAEVELTIANKISGLKDAASAFRRFAASLQDLATAAEQQAATYAKVDARVAKVSEEWEEFHKPAASGSRSPSNTGRSRSPVAVCEASVSPERGRSPVSRSPQSQSFGGLTSGSPALMLSSKSTAPSAAPEVDDLSETEVEALREKQRSLRALLPSIDHHSTAYRMVVSELASNERHLQRHRERENTAKLARSAELGAARKASRMRSICTPAALQTETSHHLPPPVIVDPVVMSVIAGWMALCFTGTQSLAELA